MNFHFTGPAAMAAADAADNLFFLILILDHDDLLKAMTKWCPVVCLKVQEKSISLSSFG
jgi:hypothetical protein